MFCAKCGAYMDDDARFCTVCACEKVEISEAYVSKELVTNPEEAADQITKESQKNEIYEVRSGDTLSTIANGHGLLVKEGLALNSGLTEHTTLQIGDEIIITVPQPELTIMTTEQSTYEEEYFAEEATALDLIDSTFKSIPINKTSTSDYFEPIKFYDTIALILRNKTLDGVNPFYILNGNDVLVKNVLNAQSSDDKPYFNKIYKNENVVRRRPSARHFLKTFTCKICRILLYYL